MTPLLRTQIATGPRYRCAHNLSFSPFGALSQAASSAAHRRFVRPIVVAMLKTPSTATEIA